MFAVSLHIINFLDLQGLAIYQERSRAITAHRHIALTGSLQGGNDIAHTLNLAWRDMLLRLTNEQAVVLRPNQELASTDGHPTQCRTLRHLVGDNI